MLTSRALLLSRLLANSLKGRVGNNQVVRQGHGWHYREGPAHLPKNVTITADLVGGFMWWWVLWHMWHEPEHVFGGEWIYPDIEAWTDKELGIPPDSEDD